jgi:hypothetical protein
MNTVLCWRNTTSNTTRFTSSNPLMDNFPMMPPLTGLGIGGIAIFYIYAAPTALLPEILRLQNVQTPDPTLKRWAILKNPFEGIPPGVWTFRSRKISAKSAVGAAYM